MWFPLYNNRRLCIRCEIRREGGRNIRESQGWRTGNSHRETAKGVSIAGSGLTLNENRYDNYANTDTLCQVPASDGRLKDTYPLVNIEARVGRY